MSKGCYKRQQQKICNVKKMTSVAIMAKHKTWLWRVQQSRNNVRVASSLLCSGNLQQRPIKSRKPAQRKRNQNQGGSSKSEGLAVGAGRKATRKKSLLSLGEIWSVETFWGRKVGIRVKKFNCCAFIITTTSFDSNLAFDGSLVVLISASCHFF